MAKKWLLLFTITFIVNTNTSRTSAQHINYGSGRALQGLGSNTRRPMAANNHNESGSVANSIEPSSIISRFATFPLSIVRSVRTRVTGFFGSLISGLFSQIWSIIKTYVIPNVDRILVNISSVDAFPDNLRGLISQAHSAYQLAKMFGYFKPT